MDRRPELPGPAARHALLGVVPDRPGVGRRGDRAAVPARPRSRPAAQPEPPAALAGPGPGDHPLGDARGRRRHHVAAGLQRGRGHPQRDPARPRPRKRPRLAQRPRHRPARRRRRRRLGRDAADDGRPARRAPEHPARAARGGRGGRRGSLAPLLHGHLARPQARRARHHRAQPHLEPQLLRPGLRADQRRPRRPHPAAHALRLRRGLPLRPVRLCGGHGLRDGRRDLDSAGRLPRRTAPGRGQGGDEA